MAQHRVQIIAVMAMLLLSAAAGELPSGPPQHEPVSFTFQNVQRLAQERAAHPYRTRATRLPEALAHLNYDQYRDIRFRRTSGLWYEHSLFEVQFFHRGFNFDHRVNVYEVSAGAVRPIPYSPAMFEFGPAVPRLKLSGDLGFAGFRIHFPLNRPSYKDEVLVFLGAAYLRVLARGEAYGASARGLALDTASPAGEEFPYFTDFYLVRPEPQQRTLTLYAILDSPSMAGAYAFELSPGSVTQLKVTAQLYPRRAVQKVGLAPLTSMFLYGENTGGRRFDDFRPEVHDSDGLMMQTGGGEWLWRPLTNPRQLRVNRFMDEHPRGFGLIQRDRDFAHYQDTGARFDLRPSYWVEPLGDWGRGGVELVEIPSEEEIHDNVVAYWVPEAAAQANRPISFSYVLSAFSHEARWPPGGRVIATRFGRMLKGTTVVPGLRRVIVDFAGGDLDALDATQPVRASASASGGDLDSVTVERLPQSAGWRVAMQVRPSGDKPVELRCYLQLYGEALTETWTYLWNPAGA